jgi:hypothetical protein
MRDTYAVWVMHPDARAPAAWPRTQAIRRSHRTGAASPFASDRDENGELSYGDSSFFANELYADGSCARRVFADAGIDTWYGAPAWRPGDARTGDGRLRC